jgi:hypothetical protein
MHREPAHAQPHEVLIPAGPFLPNCDLCSGTTLSLKAYAPQPYEENEFFAAKHTKKRRSWSELLCLAQAALA